MPIFTYSIYKFIDGKGFIDFSAQAADYYQEHLLPLILATRKNDESPAAQYPYDDYRRRVLGETDAGLENVSGWLKSEEDLALRSLAHIPSPAAEAKLRELMNSKDPDLAERAEGFLDLRNRLRLGGVLK
ncbi:MAG: hypothetical protein JO336_04435 [Acidobacteriia bacterium]|nr:hypothetical protein [Terriglobia bacterium]MBV8904866.1 hypothetical protein [Terriglobia bacterium]